VGRWIGYMVMIVLVSALAACQETTTNVQTSGPTVQEALTYQGPKARIAVASFKCKAAKCSGEIGGGLSDMLATALFGTGRFVVLERGEGFEEVKKELELGQSGYVSEKKAVQKGQVESADVLVVGAITAFEPNYTGGGAGVGGLFGGVLGGVAGRLRNAYIAADVRLVDVRTGRVINATTVEGKATSWGALTGLGARVSHNVYLGGALGAYKNTPMEKAVRVMLNNAINAIAQMTPQRYYRYGESNSSVSSGEGASYASFPQVRPMSVVKDANVRTGPSTNHPILTKVTAGTQIRAMGQQGSWYQVTLPDGRIGWIYSTLVQ
jgi:curli biogenesis system outer membrane secretion channel CsgG